MAATTPKKNVPRGQILNKKIKRVKFDKNIIIMREFRNRKQITCERWNSKDITKVEFPIGMSSRKRCLTNMRDVHTFPIGGVNLVGTMIGLTSVKLAHLARQMIRGPSIHVPVGVDVV